MDKMHLKNPRTILGFEDSTLALGSFAHVHFCFHLILLVSLFCLLQRRRSASSNYDERKQKPFKHKKIDRDGKRLSSALNSKSKWTRWIELLTPRILRVYIYIYVLQNTHTHTHKVC